MKEWKLAWSLAKFELTASPIHLLALCLLGPILAFLIAYIMLSQELNNYLVNNYVGFDFWFLLIFLMVPAWLRPRNFHIQSVDQHSSLWAAPTLVLQLQLPISKDTLIKSRLMIYFFLSFPLQFVLLVSLYLTTTQLQSIISPVEYVSFCIIWLSIGVYLGYIMPASDVGDIINVKSVTIAFVMVVGGIIATLTFFHLIIGYGLVYSTILLAKNYPIFSIIGSIGLLIIGLFYWKFYMKKQLQTIDYF